MPLLHVLFQKLSLSAGPAGSHVGSGDTWTTRTPHTPLCALSKFYSDGRQATSVLRALRRLIRKHQQFFHLNIPSPSKVLDNRP